jgi:peptidyl-prolyl cis-trans isomerase D
VFSDASLTQRRVGGPLPLGEERMVIFQVEAHSPASTKPLDQVRADVIKAITRERGAEAAYAAAETAVADLDKGANFAQVAARLKAKTEGPRFVSRGSPDLPVQVRDALFAAARPENGKPVRKALKIDDGGAALFEATRTQAQTMLGNPQLVDIRSRRELDRYTRRDIEAYLADVVGSAKVRKNPQAFQQ